LLLEYGNGGHWDYAKGGVERGEGERDAAARELREETGLSGVRFVEGFRETLHYFFRDKHAKTKTEGDGNPPLVSKTVAFFLAEAPANARVKLSREHSDYAWLSFEDAVAKATFRNAKETLRKTEEFLKAKEK
jgi:8-oxo-dGTP pyrophosphatase MutT (NUDIX family)